MPKALLWVNKDAQSTELSRSAGEDAASIRRHVQKQRQRLHENEIEERNLRNALPSPASLVVYSHVPTNERRSLDYFINRTGRLWTGWQDDRFWNDVAPRLSQTSAAVRYSLVSLASFHESLASPKNSPHALRLTTQSHQQGDKAIATTATNPGLTYLEGLVSCVAILSAQSILHGHQSLRLLLSGAMMLEECERLAAQGCVPQSQLEQIHMHITPIYDRLCSRLCVMTDPIYSLRTSIRRGGRDLQGLFRKQPIIPPRFDTLLEARNSLYHILSWAHDAYGAQEVGPFPSTKAISIKCQAWCSALDSTILRPGSKEDLAKIHFLQAGCLHGQVILESLSFDTEMEYDKLLSVFEKTLSHVEKALSLTADVSTGIQISFGIDDGLVDILAFIGMRCREPLVRRRAIELMIQGGRKEGGRLAFTGGVIAQVLMKMEEGALVVTSASDISNEHRWKLAHGEQYIALRKICLTFASSPSVETVGEDTRLEQVWIDLPSGMDTVDALDDATSGGEAVDGMAIPETVFGRGFVAFLTNRKARKYHRISDRPFYFPIPRG